MYRSITSERSDHALLECTWKWRMRLVKSAPAPDFSALRGETINEQGQSGPNQYVQAFGKAVQSKLQALQFSASGSAATMYDKMCTAIQFATEEVLPKARRKTCIRRKVSKETRDLYDERERGELDSPHKNAKPTRRK